jgi:hypothetical protein
MIVMTYNKSKYLEHTRSNDAEEKEEGASSMVK